MVAYAFCRFANSAIPQNCRLASLGCVRLLQAILLASLPLALVSCAPPPPTFHGTVISPILPAPDVDLPDVHGKTFRLADHRGKVVVLFFGFAHCPDVCPSTLRNWKTVAKTLGDVTKQIAFVFVTVDPARDGQEALRSYLSQYDSSIIGLTGTAKEMERVFTAYGVHAERLPGEPGGGYSMTHPNSLYMIDKGGNWRLTYPYDIATEDLVSDIRWLLRESL